MQPAPTTERAPTIPARAGRLVAGLTRRSNTEFSVRRRIAIGVIAVIALIGIWYLATDVLRLINPLSLPSPAAIVQRLLALTGTPYLGATIWGHAWASIQVAFSGWALGGLVGVPLGVFMVWNRMVRNLTYPTFQMLRSISPIAWIPLAIVWLGIDASARIFIVFIAAVVPWTVNSMEAVRSVDPRLIKAGRVLGARRRMLTSIVLPAGLPILLAGARIALGNAWTALIAGELLAATAGLGFMALNSSRVLDTPTMLAAMVVIGALGMLFSFVLLRLARVVAPWAKNS